MTAKSELSEVVVRQYAKGLSELNLDLIAPILHPEFKFVYRIANTGIRIVAHPELLDAVTALNDRGHGIRTDVRYIGHLYKTFLAMKNEGVTSIMIDYFYSDIDGEKILCIKLLPPHDRRIIYPMDDQLKESFRGNVPKGDVYMLPRVKHGQLCKIECYDSLEAFKSHVKGTFYRNAIKKIKPELGYDA